MLNSAKVVLLFSWLAIAACAEETSGPSQETSSQETSSQSANAMEVLIGTWMGDLTVPGATLPIVINIAQDYEGNMTSTLDSPTQGAFGLGVEDLTLEDRTVSFTSKVIGGSFEGLLSEDEATIDGMWSQGGNALPLLLTRTTKDEATAEISSPDRPQHPKPPFPYTSEDISFLSADGTTTLAGTLSTPPGAGPFSSVVLLSGSGPQNRDSTISGHRYFSVIADHLTRQGLVVLRFDDRGIAKSGGDMAIATTHDFASDALGAVTYLHGHASTASGAVALIGHSEGSIVASLAAGQSDLIDRTVHIAGPMVPYSEMIIDQVRAISRAAGHSEAITVAQVEAQQKIVDAALAAGNDPQAVIEAVAAELQKLGMSEADARQQAAVFGSPWMMVFLSLDPREAIGASDQPMLAIWGTKDVQVTAERNAGALRAVANEDRATIRIFEGLNHLMQPAKTGAVEEYGEIPITISPEVLEMIPDWLADGPKE